ncbi:MAG: hypothetical protein IH948_05775 [Bacteroidetes bacterium]|nr:hypothetical protein [Bacteroidota bacterium]
MRILLLTLVLMIGLSGFNEAYAVDCREIIAGRWHRVDIDDPATYWTFRITRREGNPEGTISCTGNCNRSWGRPLTFKVYRDRIGITYSKRGNNNTGCRAMGNTVTIDRIVLIR